jgi:hypothetical protein
VKRWWYLTLVGCTLASVACDEHGVSLGTEELCQSDPLLVSAQENGPPVALPPCASVGDNRLVNASFETPVIGDCNSGHFCQFSATSVPGWDTTSEMQVIEVWADQNSGFPAYEGKQYVELDAMSQDTVFQDLALPAGQLMYWSLAHHGRNGLESFELLIGAPDAPTSQRLIESSNDGWTSFSGLYRVGPDEPITRFALSSRTAGSEGNLVDAVVFAPVQ